MIIISIIITIRPITIIIIIIIAVINMNIFSPRLVYDSNLCAPINPSLPLSLLL